MERILVRNLETLEQFLKGNNINDQNAVKGFVMGIFGFCSDIFSQIKNDNSDINLNLEGFRILDDFLKSNPNRDIENIEFDKFIEIAKALVAEKENLNEIFKLTKRVQHAKYEIF